MSSPWRTLEAHPFSAANSPNSLRIPRSSRKSPMDHFSDFAAYRFCHSARILSRFFAA
jgi:hypothetical protein